MKYSKINTKTNKTSKDYDSANAKYLIKGGFIHQTMAGAYTFLPLGLKVLRKIEQITKEEMEKIGVEIYMPAISPKELWEQTNRIDSVDVLFKVSAANSVSNDKSSNEYILNSTHEELVTPISQFFNKSYKDFPHSYFQIQDKFRNEPRAKSGILRGRTFRMKDLYSFHTSEEDLLDYYHNKAKASYTRVFERLGLGEHTVIALASGGDFTDEYSHEFQTICDSGEDTLFFDESENIYYNKEVTPCMAPPVENIDTEMKEIDHVFGEHITGMEELVKFLKVPAEKCVKTLIFEADDDRVIVAPVRGDRDIDEIKLKSVTGAKNLRLASEETVKRITGAEIGYAGIINLKDNVELFFDDSIEPLVNFECGTNKTNYHTININWGRDIEKPEKFYDIKVAQEGDINPKTNKVYKTFSASEVGNIFPLNTKFTDAFDYTFMDKDGKPKPIYMGCYGIGTSRAVGVAVERFNDDKGIIWPMSIAPFQVHIANIGKEEESSNKAEELYKSLTLEGVEVLWDDRNEGPGAKLGDADLIGIPIRIVVSKRSMENGGYEVKMRNEADSQIIKAEDISEWVKTKIKSEMAKFN